MTDDHGERLARVETKLDHTHETSKRWGAQFQESEQKLSAKSEEHGTRLTKLEGKMGIVWAVLAALALMIGSALFNYFAKGGAL